MAQGNQLSPHDAARPKVFGVGMMKTGTTTLGECLTSLGFSHRPYYPKLIRQIDRGDFSRVWDVVDRYESFEDNPWPMIYSALDDRYPGSKFVLTVRRDTETWWQSMTAHARRMGPTAERKIIYGHGYPTNRNKRSHTSAYEKHNMDVRAHFESREDQFLEVCWETGSTVQEVAEFVGVSAPAAAVVPRLNTAKGSRVSPRFWLRNSVKWATISGLGFDPGRDKGFDA